MNDRLPIPTDNIYKFYALFGMLVMLTSAIMFFARHDHYRTTAVENYLRIVALENKESISEKDKLEVELINSIGEALQGDREFELQIYNWSFAIGVAISIVGFYIWQVKVQPRQDELLDLEIEKLRRELGRDGIVP